MIKADDLAGLAMLMDLEELPDARGAAGDTRGRRWTGGPRSSWVRSTGTTRPACKPSQPAAMASGLRVILGEVEKIQLHPRVGKRHSLAIGIETTPPLSQPAGSERLGEAGSAHAR